MDFAKRFFCFGGIDPFLVCFAFIWIAAWYSNAVHKTSFDMAQFTDMVKWLVANHFVNSGLNSPLGKPVNSNYTPNNGK